MRADGNRNAVVQAFLESKADWLMWIDTDNTLPLGGIRRLLNTDKQLVTALYYSKVPPFNPIAYTRNETGTYNPIKGWRRGEIIPVDAAGMGACLSHRSVYEDIQEQCTVVQKTDGGLMTIPKNRIDKKGIPDKQKMRQPFIADGILKESVCKPTFDFGPFPYFCFGYGRSEDLQFYELAKQCGHEAWCDTSVECDHINNEWIINGKTYREYVKKISTPVPIVKEYVNIDTEGYAGS